MIKGLATRFIDLELQMINPEDIKPLTNTPVSTRESIVGDCPDNLKPLFSPKSKKDRELGHSLVDLKSDFSEERQLEANKLSYEVSLVDEVFWYELRTTLNFWSPNIGIRNDWKIVTWEVLDNPFLDLFRSLGGST